MSYLKRLVPNATLAFLFLAVVATLPPSHVRRLFHVPLWRSAIVVGILIAVSFALAALFDWDEERRFRKLSRSDIEMEP